MSTFIDVDSTYRDYTTYPNICNFVITSEQMRSWPKEPRQVTSHNSRPGSRMLEFSQSLQIKTLTLPYATCTYTYGLVTPSVVVNTHTADLQRIYLDFHTLRFDDTNLIYTIDNKVPKARFVLCDPRIQYDSLGIPRWVQFYCRMDQAMRFSRSEPFKVEVMQEEGYGIVITDTFVGNDPIVGPPLGPPGYPTKSLQMYISVDVTPYFRDGHYANQELGLFSNF